MTLSPVMSGSRPRSAARPTGIGSLTPATLIVIGSLLSFVLSWSHLVTVWATGTYFDTDDAMRMVQVRAWLDGQSWFDLTAHRLAPPAGVVMHWSRVVDVPLAAMIRVFELFTRPATAEALTRIVFPLAMQSALIAATIYTARVLSGPAGGLPAMILVVTSCFQFSQFPAGRIDHHAPQIALLMAMTGLVADCVLTRRARSAFLASLCMACSVAISLENLPFIAVLIAALCLGWVVVGAEFCSVIAAFAVGLILFAPAFFLGTVPPTRYVVVAPDAFSFPHVLAALAGGCVLLALSRMPRRYKVGTRAAASIVGGMLVGILVVALCPGVLRSPYADIAPVVRDVWLSRVTEALPLSTALRLHPQAVPLILCPLLAGLACSLVAIFREAGAARAAWLLVAALTLMGLAGSMWEVRVVSSTAPLALLGGVWAFKALAARLSKRRWSRFAGASLAFLSCSSMAWAFVPTPDESASVAKATADAQACREAGNVTALDQLGSGLLFAPIDSGSHILVHTKLSVVGAPYHRNNAGNLAVIEGFSADPTEAETIVKSTGARYVALCPGQVQAEALTTRNPGGLASRLLSGDVPTWLEPVTITGTSYKVFAVQ